MSEKVKVKVRLNGRSYSLRIKAEYEALFRDAVKRLDDEIRNWKMRYDLPDDVDVLAMVLLSQTMAKEICLQEQTRMKEQWEKHWGQIEDVLGQLEADIEQN